MFSKLQPFLLFLASFIALELVNILLGRGLNHFGLIPRSVSHLYGIFTAPWLHASIGHLLANLSALAVLGVIVWQWGQKRFWKITLFIIVTSGLLVWIFARPAFHIGASGLVYGYFGFCLIGGWLSRRPLLIILSLCVAVVYGSMMWGVLPIRAGVSFEFHLAGFFMGLVAARLWAKGQQKKLFV
ncbi:rhomboid family intramembrane serine protease [Alteromonas sediminis]|uniref:Rhomboid family intramembrane serine protease n=1 Tax=Alteromonas sediminis TaxID=2259342 RepID=A0A3N5Z968_9ALTE|nr:rhomboid family intramembrane serine protease [Alteromonas sediminis]RPJ65698.1 rhomboid family intramembrane serine protease [Alteromonas sediminis]